VNTAEAARRPGSTGTDSHYEADVVISGAGPVGLTLALDLASRGVSVIVLETRPRGMPPSVKCNHVSARSMEIFRRLGLAPAVRNAGLPADFPNDVSYRTTTLGKELTRIKIPARRDRYIDHSGPDGWWPTPEPPHRINQIFLEPILFDHAARAANLTLLNETRLQEYSESDDEVRARAEHVQTGAPVTVRGRFLIGCDGGKSLIRKLMGAQFVGDPVIQKVQSTYIRAPGLLGRLPGPPAWATFSLNPRRCGNVYAIDGRETWLVHNYLTAAESDFEAVDRDRCIRAILGVGADFEYEVLTEEDWIGRRLVADRFRDRRVFLCGDSAHIWVPYAGYGMNAGIADAANLAWLLGAHLKGWAPEGVLSAYERERLPITAQVSRFAMDHALAMNTHRAAVPPDIEASTAEGTRRREELGRAMYDLNVKQYCCAGLNFGYYYDESPLIAYDESGCPPPYTMDTYTASTAPGARLPHFWIEPEVSLYDELGPYYTLMRFDPTVDVTPLTSAAASVGLPLEVLDIPNNRPPIYRHNLVLARADQHVAWRGDRCPSHPRNLVDLLRGASI
jgi:2-polyprenyl-6-methoxyphenol hydroxylase-like FAD-dependent oxidoreductase